MNRPRPVFQDQNGSRFDPLSQQPAAHHVTRCKAECGSAFRCKSSRLSSTWGTTPFSGQPVGGLPSCTIVLRQPSGVESIAEANRPPKAKIMKSPGVDLRPIMNRHGSVSASRLLLRHLLHQRVRDVEVRRYALHVVVIFRAASMSLRILRASSSSVTSIMFLAIRVILLFSIVTPALASDSATSRYFVGSQVTSNLSSTCFTSSAPASSSNFQPLVLGWCRFGRHKKEALVVKHP